MCASKPVDEINTVTFRKVVLVGSSLELHSTLKDKKKHPVELNETENVRR